MSRTICAPFLWMSPPNPCHFPDCFFHRLKRLGRRPLKDKKRKKEKESTVFDFWSFSGFILSVKKKKKKNSLECTHLQLHENREGLILHCKEKKKKKRYRHCAETTGKDR